MTYFNSPTDIQRQVWKDKYRQEGETDIRSSLMRVVNGVYKKDPSAAAKADALEAVLNGDWVPAGRIHAGAGTDKRVTLINCYVSPRIQDSLATDRLTIDDNKNPMVRYLNKKYDELVGDKGIMEALSNAAYTMQMGGGIGMDFSTIRPKGAIVKRTGSVSSGVLPFMDMWHSMCATIMSSGSRRGAMMGCLRIDHPDVIDFIKAKQTPGRLTNFNVSVLVTDAFMKAVENNQPWFLEFPIEPADTAVEGSIKNIEIGAWTYKRIMARELWDMLLQATYEHAEPGVIFIDRVNSRNNLNYCETIAATNPCGEQPLPPNGACNLGAVNLANMVHKPFTSEASVDFTRLERAVQVGTRFLDNVLDVTQFPTEAQQQESNDKRRIGLGVTGLGNMLQQLGLRYGSEASVGVTRRVMRYVAFNAYNTSWLLAKERGPFPLWDKDKFNYGLVERLGDERLLDAMRSHGLRNGVLLTVAPTGTTSLYYGNVSSGLEPPFALEYYRKVLQPDGSFKESKVRDWGFQKFMERQGYPDKYATIGSDVDAIKADNMMPDYMATALELSVQDHLAIQAACQEWVDASISKTINCPAEMTFDDFKHVYTEAYRLGCKGCTTYRPSGVRGAVLTTESQVKDGQPLKSVAHPAGPAVPEDADVKTESLVNGVYDTETRKMDFSGALGAASPRPRVLRGTTYKIRWPKADHAHYVTINDREDGTPFEIFINSKSVLHAEWTAAVTRLISAVFRKGGDVHFLIEELEQVHATEGGAWLEGKYVPSMVAMLGRVIQEHLLGGPKVVEQMKNETVALTGFEKDFDTTDLLKKHAARVEGHSAYFDSYPKTSGLAVPVPPNISGKRVTFKDGNLEVHDLSGCPACGQPTAYKQEGCLKCLSCGHSDCG